MATTEKNVLMRGKDSDGNPILYYPITTAENVDGLDEALNTKSDVQVDGNFLSTLNIHKLTQEEYDQAVDEGTLDENALYLTPDEEIDLSGYATIEALNEKADSNHNHDSSYDTKGAADTALASAKSYADAKIAALVDSAPETMNTLNELATAIVEHQDITDALDAAISNKANTSDLATLQTQVANKTTVQIITWEDDD